ncbi:hypothetical protein D3C86_1857650 [compost metagenome]
MRNHDGRVDLLRIVVGRRVNVGRDVQAIELVADRMDVDLAGLVLGNCAVVSQCERVFFVVRSKGFARRKANQRRHERGFHKGVYHVKLLSN